MKYVTIVVMLALLAGCGGGKRSKREDIRVTRFSSGPISAACLQADRKAANRDLCGCVQTVANRSLSGADQRFAATFFKDPHKAQEIRQSDNSSHEAFWQRYKAFAEEAEVLCQGY
ncbi:hypothetical protein VK792_14325 [Mesobacterium sp. TK19101]|uniref:Arginine transporter n=1 Tax=Mesobacterium hydrothermale TaxID=3111907 RepID=A0ABU6HKU0_9RHOB|nr:hypothetical protein [Mesobacterium sp. TK19101]MEC3862465.1 hypothetical protein [Mesobacterium sp. TK19101]